MKNGNRKQMVNSTVRTLTDIDFVCFIYCLTFTVHILDARYTYLGYLLGKVGR